MEQYRKQPLLGAFQQPAMRSVGENETVEGRLKGILATNSPLMEKARTRAAQAANRRGLSNSSMSVQAGEEAVMGAALPIAQQDAATYSTAAAGNQAADNTFRAAGNQYGYNRGLSDQNFYQQVGSDKYGSGLIAKHTEANLALKESDQDFAATQAGLDRELQRSSQASDQDFKTGESALERAARLSAQESDQDFKTEVLEKELANRSSEAALDRTQQSSVQQSDQDFRGDEARLDRGHQERMEETRQRYAVDLANISNDAREDLLELESGFRSQLQTNASAAAIHEQLISQIGNIQAQPDVSSADKGLLVRNLVAAGTTSLQAIKALTSVALPGDETDENETDTVDPFSFSYEAPPRPVIPVDVTMPGAR